MKRIIEKLAQERLRKEQDFKESLQKIEDISEKLLEKNYHSILNHIKKLEESFKQENFLPSPSKKGLFPRPGKFLEHISAQKKHNEQILLTLKEFEHSFRSSTQEIRDLFSSLIHLLQMNADLTMALIKEYDALGSNHVGMIFKSMEWRVDKLATSCEDANTLIKKFIHIREQLTRFINHLEKKETPSIQQAKELLHPIRDWRYMGFENRFRGPEEEVKKQQLQYLPYFQKGIKVLDLGCGRGEFMELLEEKGIKVEGIDINEQMIQICQDKGLNCKKADILTKLAEYEDESLGGIFSSQVIEHLDPEYLQRMIELIYFKLAPSGICLLETINPTSVFTLVQIYFLDLTHQKPIHPLTLKYLLENSGFETVELLYSPALDEEQLQNLSRTDEVSTIINQNIDKLNSLLFSPPNYAAIGRKKDQ